MIGGLLLRFLILGALFFGVSWIIHRFLKPIVGPRLAASLPATHVPDSSLASTLSKTVLVPDAVSPVADAREESGAPSEAEAPADGTAAALHASGAALLPDIPDEDEDNDARE